MLSTHLHSPSLTDDVAVQLRQHMYATAEPCVPWCMWGMGHECVQAPLALQINNARSHSVGQNDWDLRRTTVLRLEPLALHLLPFFFVTVVNNGSHARAPPFNF